MTKHTFLSILLLLIPFWGFSQLLHNEVDSVVIVEMESIKPASGWAFKNEPSGYTGNGFFEWVGADRFNDPGYGLLQFQIQITNPGTYRFKWRNRVGYGTSSTDYNDTWLRIPGADDFYGLKGTHVVRPKGVCTTDCPEGSGKNGWFKIYLSGTLNWTWSTNTSDNDPHSIFAQFNEPGIYTVEISGRSKHHQIDRFVMYHTAYSGGAGLENSSLSGTPYRADQGVQHTVSFLLVDENEQVINAFPVIFNKQEYLTGEDGRIELESILGGNYIYKINQPSYIAYTGNFYLDKDTLINLKIAAVVSISGEKKSHGTKLYPNPAKDQISITPATNLQSLIIYNSQGIKVLQLQEKLEIETLNIPLGDLEAGVYIVEINRFNEPVERRKIILK